jgi:hypothetical protein
LIWVDFQRQNSKTALPTATKVKRVLKKEPKNVKAKATEEENEFRICGTTIAYSEKMLQPEHLSENHPR